ncbi:MAG: hypothetical protein PHD56_05095 [Anaerostipes sp.]|nr:hypothetical protein [Anaerostipes sp.]
MYPVSQAFMDAIESNTRKYYWTGTIVTKNKKEYAFGNEDIVKGSGYITRQCCGSNEIELGTVYAAEMGITLFSDIDRYTLDEAEVRIYFHLVLPDGTEESIPMGVFEVSEANRHIKTLELKAYDYMLRFEKALKLTASGGTAYSFLLMASTECNVALAQSKAEIEAMPNGKETLGIYSDNDMESYRDLIFYVAQLLGCVCQINREGKLELIPYGISPVAEVTSRHRFDSSYSDFVTRYTAVSSTNLITEESEYYALDPDDALTLNLGVNPLLQFGLKTTRARLITNILNAIAVVDYVPFDSTTIGNPAFDPMDVLRFSGGHADEKQLSCITSITYKINGKHSLKCVGKNPKLAAAKSKNDKNITGLLNQIEAGKIVVYNFINASPFTIGSSNTEIMAIAFTSKEETTATFLAEILFEVTNDEVERTVHGTVPTVDEEGTEGSKEIDFTFSEVGQSELTVTYKMNDEEVKTFYPKKTCINGKHILTLFLPITQVIANSENTLAVYFKIAGGTLTIGESQIRATISGQGLVAGIGDWNGRISISETIDRVPIAQTTFGYDAFIDTAAIVFPRIVLRPITQPLTRIPIMESEFTYHRLNERVTAVEVIKTFTMDKDFPPHYDQTVVELNEDSAFCMISDYSFVSSAEEINAGQLQHLTVDTEPFERVERLEVTTC